VFKFLLVVIVIAAAAGWWYWTTTPQYSVLKIHDAVKSHDLASFQKYVDVDSVASHMVDDLLTKPVQNALGPGIVGQLLGFGIGMLVKPMLVASMKQEITDYVTGEASASTSWNSNDRYQPVGAHIFRGIPGQLGFTGKVYKGIDYVRTEGKVSLVGLKLYNEKYNADLVLELKLRNADGYWRLTELSNLQSFMSKITDLQLQGGKQTESMFIEPMLLRNSGSSSLAA
jgi:hypothetical protein